MGNELIFNPRSGVSIGRMIRVSRVLRVRRHTVANFVEMPFGIDWVVYILDVVVVVLESAMSGLQTQYSGCHIDKYVS